MVINEEVISCIERIVEQFKKDQTSDGSWRYCLELSPIMDSHLIILLRLLEIKGEEELIARLAKRILSKQAGNGAWKLYHDDEGDLETTIEAYYALLFSKYSNTEDENMKKAERFIRAKGGIGKVKKLFTLVLLAITGEIDWPKNFNIPPEFILLPNNFPINKYDLVGHARVHFIPIMIMANQKFSLKNKYTPDLSHLYVNKKQMKDKRVLLQVFLNLLTLPIKLIPPLSKHLNKRSMLTGEQFLLDRIEPDGTLYSFSPATVYMIFSMLSLGYSKQSEIIKNAIDGIKSLICSFEENDHLQAATSTIWDTAIISVALQEANVSIKSPTIKSVTQYLISRQHQDIGDWIVHNPRAKPGGWAFSDINTKYPDVDDSVMALRALKSSSIINKQVREAWNKGLNWVLSMQNDDGGWPAFEKNTDKQLINLIIPYEVVKDFATDPSVSDLTARVLQFLGHDCGMTLKHRRIKKTVHWLRKQQEKNGSWYGRWGICYIHGTSAVVLGLLAVGVSPLDPAIRKAHKWLLSIQNDDGGWGESCHSDVHKKYVPLQYSNLTQTAWSLEMLIALHEQPTEEINKGIQYLINSLKTNHWATVYPTGGGIPGSVYFYYHSFNDMWALLTLAKYKQKYID